MFYFYSGQKPLDIRVPGEQYTYTVEPSERSQKTNHEGFYAHIFSNEFEHKGLFTKTESFEPPVFPKFSKGKAPEPVKESGNA